MLPALLSESSETGWWTGVVAIIAAVSSLLVAVLPKLAPFFSKRAAERAEKVRLAKLADAAFDSLVHLFDARLRIKSALLLVIQKTCAERVVILRSENGGGIPNASGPVYLTCVDEVTNGDIAPIKLDWQRRIPTTWYEQHVLRPLAESGRVTLLADGIPEGEDLRGVYHHQGVKRAEVFVVGVTPMRALVYVSIGWRSDAPPSEGDLYEMQTLVSALARIYREGEEIYSWESMQEGAKQIRERMFPAVG